jgi:hypothetical protein
LAEARATQQLPCYLQSKCYYQRRDGPPMVGLGEGSPTVNGSIYAVQLGVVSRREEDVDNTLLVSLNRAELTTKDDWSLIWTCVSPFVSKVRGKNDLMKMNVYRQLSEHQKRLFIFTIYYNHARQSVDDFIYYGKLLLENNYWHELTEAMGFFRNSRMVDLLNRIETEMKKSQLAATTDFPADEVMAASIKDLFKSFLPVSDETLKLIGDDIRRNPTAYFNIQDQDIDQP